MKKLKVNLMMVLALVIGAATMSFKLGEKNIDVSSVDDVEVWQYTEETTSGHNNPANYIPATGNENCPGETLVRCTLNAPDDGSGQPDLSQATNITFKAK